MPSNFTQPVMTGEVTSFPDFALDCARGVGATIAMRDMPSDAPLTDENLTFNTDYHVNAAMAAAERINEVKSWTEEESEEAARLHNQENLKGYLQGVRESRETARRYGYMALQVEAWTPPTEDHEGFKKYMAEQLETSLRFDGREPERPEKVDGPTLQAQEIESAEHSINYHREQMTKDTDANNSRVLWVRSLQSSLVDWQPVEPPTRQLP
jgi:hypothetical protein